MKKRIQIIALVLSIIFINIGCDQGTKEYARQNIKGQGIINVVGDYFILQYVENSGAFLSAGSNLPQPYKTIILVIFPLILVIASILYLFLSKSLTLPQIISLACVIGGGSSNLIDRIIYKGSVTDFLNFGIGNIRTGILNFADLSITFGAIIFVLLQYYEERKLRRTA